ncbi:MAG: hypothetical protein CVU44_20545 [Chloroflexi bacterium HGW-Chloroflexi-6]|nr:MAG: hypothetical protein CVU44_20545 [Chloroflexi bacterium HGW-Chloroflexi-6]
MKKTELRQQAEASLGQQKKASMPATEIETQRLVHELQVHQIELELQNQELAQARAETEAALRQYTALYDFAPVGYLTLARDGAIHQVNLAGAALLGLERGQLLQRRLGIFAAIQSRPILSTFLDQVFSSGKNQVCEIELLQAGSAPLWVHLEAVITDEEHETCRVVLVDIGERRRAENELHKSHALLQAALDQSPAGIAIADAPDGTLRFVNNASLRIRGSDRQSIVDGVGINQYAASWQLLDLDGRPLRTDEVPLARAVMFGETNSREFIVRRASNDDRIVLGNAAPIKDDSGKVVAAIVVFTDITERKQMEDALRKSENEFRMLAESMPQMVWVCQPDGKNIYFNQHWVDYTGLTLDESYGDGWNKPFHPDDQPRAWEAWQSATKSLSEYSLECRLRRADGTYTWWLIRGVPLVDAEGQVLKWFGTCTDIHKLMQAENEIRQLNATLEERGVERTRDLREAQEQLILKEKLAVLGQLASGVAYKLRNPLTAIQNAVYYLNLIQPEKNEKIDQYHGLIEQEAHEAQKIITDLLDFAVIPSSDPEPVSIPELVQRVMERHPQPPLIKVALNLPADLPKVYADLLQMEQVLGNLILNANQAMSSGGQLEIGAQLAVIHTADPAVAITVKDNGTGISPENMQKLFMPLFTTKAKSLGLGLALSQKLVEANGGKIEVASEPDQGSTFTVFLPVYSK